MHFFTIVHRLSQDVLENVLGLSYHEPYGFCWFLKDLFCIAGFGPFEHFESLNGHLCHFVPVGVTLTLLFFNCNSSEMWEINKLVRDATI